MDASLAACYWGRGAEALLHVTRSGVLGRCWGLLVHMDLGRYP